MNIYGNTEIYALIGNNITHSLSPQIQNFLIKHYNLNAVYIPFELKQNIENFIDFFRKVSNFKGANITIPYKENILRFCDEVSDIASQIGAINTIKKINNKIIGTNTDSYGFLKSLRDDLNFSPKNKKIVVIGAGGTAKTIIYSLIDKTNFVYVISRRDDNIKELLNKNKKIKWIKFNNDEKSLSFENIDLIVNTTPLGLYGEEININFNILKKNCKIFDVLYVKTPLIAKAKKLGINCTNGINMLIYQAIKSFEFWTSLKVSDTIIYKLKKEVVNAKEF